VAELGIMTSASSEPSWLATNEFPKISPRSKLVVVGSGYVVAVIVTVTVFDVLGAKNSSPL
jgi:hypothetical protein